MTTPSAFIDILSSCAELGYFDAIHDEAAPVCQTEEDWGKLASLLKRGSMGVCGLWPVAEPSQNKRRNARRQKTKGGENSM